jgi:hypothetical protein
MGKALVHPGGLRHTPSSGLKQHKTGRLYMKDGKDDLAGPKQAETLLMVN